jgi:hypothetical protein
MPVSEPTKTMRRRDVLTGLAAGVAGAVVMPGVAAHTHEADASLPQAATGSPASADQAMPRLLDDHRLAMLDGLADQLVPGARAAGVANLLDRVLAVEPATAQRRFLNALGAFERDARDRHGKGWMEVTAAQQLEILRAASAQASARPAPPAWTRGQPIERPEPPTTPANLRDHLDHLKDWVQRAYFTTAAGMKEFGFTGDTAFESFPGCPHKSSNSHES